ncbi:MAG: hypothetical protein RMI45_07760 [Ignisphaera sp.]|nr:hypothetical protein [Ignisphaera sp.]MDW8086110.1 hypothetical protein [Ignisphaera sp.]
MGFRYEDGAQILVCPRCGYKSTATFIEMCSFKKSLTLHKIVERKELAAFDIPPTAIYANNLVCPKCNSKSIYYWRKYVSAAESSDTIEKTFKCANCGHMWTEIE